MTIAIVKFLQGTWVVVSTINSQHMDNSLRWRVKYHKPNQLVTTIIITTLKEESWIK